ncbi:MAG: bifunctional glutamate N-acetyltransferase/amino-acid acetyltransferase ArgJ [Chloroflexi bacterium]|nr:bifunctional glutamate N-acetyltransferase/amino-acid acetyltransferase ArgJ [Chloroflexota bacterium]MCI0814476.1 bifunctional glutamate N-acetyltransferase/amino-acid acetyltransferase ArgJ [Chloroflexota bacterium]MCI0839044.1 bifunctional glutamate N-acetyltransferase/amino-acid acetyltransferase ArgJ [Chloroflexota bacterium]MCI0883687.1 bifunctional glutamate N-acetyltransferase/amino-acid acetyltransferase ArgJ [Chloroflexota bacterium]MCI0884580.1 bifunctional glutamate N-acetyltrans
MVTANAKETKLEIMQDGGITSAQGFTAGGVHVGVRDDWTKLDVGLVYSEAPCTTAAVYTSNTLKAAPLLLTREHLKNGKAQAIVANSGCANAATGQQGAENAVAMAKLAADKLGVEPKDVVVASTGVIGTQLPMNRIARGVAETKLAGDGGDDFAVSIMTTDTVKKQIAVSFGGWTIGAACKGVGMIHPNMATMLCFMTTDAPVEEAFLSSALKEAVDVSFNMVDIDNDTSTNDMAIVLANGLAGGEAITAGHPQAEAFQKALTLVCTSMARMMVSDAEGGTKLIEMKVEGAANPADARRAAREVVTSIGVKTAIYGEDANWGRILAAIGNSGANWAEPTTALYLRHPDGGEVCLYRDGAPQDYDEAEAKACLAPAEVLVRIDLGQGTGEATAWGSDLTEEFVRLNSMYTT